MEKVTIPKLWKMKERGEKFTLVTAYDYPMAVLVDKAGVDLVLVGDSLGMVVLGYPNTLSVSMDIMLKHAESVARGVKRALVIGDMPFMSYASVDDAIRNAGAFLKVGCDAVKMEGGAEIEKIVKGVVAAGIPVMGHIGLTPQRFALLGGFKVQGRDVNSALKVINDAKALERAGAFAVLLEAVTAEVAKIITKELSIPLIDGGSGNCCHGHGMVITDLLGLTLGAIPKFAKPYANLSEIVLEAVKKFVEDVKTGKFPTEDQTFHMEKEEVEKLYTIINKRRQTKT